MSAHEKAFPLLNTIRQIFGNHFGFVPVNDIWKFTYFTLKHAQYSSVILTFVYNSLVDMFLLEVANTVFVLMPTC